jgi:hypothetical protein
VGGYWKVVPHRKWGLIKLFVQFKSLKSLVSNIGGGKNVFLCKKRWVTMSQSKVYFVILSFTFLITSTTLASDLKNSQFKYLAPLSTNLKQLHDIENLEEPERPIPDNDFIYNKKEIPENFKHDYEIVIEFSKSAAEKARETELKAKEIEREVRKRKLEGERELKKLMDRIDREHRKYIVEIEKEQRKHREEMERAYRKRLKEMEDD